MQRLLMAAGSILLLTTVAHSQPFALHRPAHPTVFILAGDEDSGDSSDAADAGATDDGAGGSSDSGAAAGSGNADEGSSAASDVGATDNGGGDQGPDADDASATDDSAGAAPVGAPPGPPPLTNAPQPGPPPSFATLGGLGGTIKNWVTACHCAR